MKGIKAGLAILTVMTWAGSTMASFQNIWVSDNGGGISLVPATSTSGTVLYFGSDAFWSLVISTAVASPPAAGQGTLSAPVMDFQVTARSLAVANANLHPLTIAFGADGFGPTSGVGEATFSGHTVSGVGQPLTFDTFYSAANVLVPNPSATVLTTSGLLGGPIYNGSWASSAVNLAALYSLTEVMTIQASPTEDAAYSLNGSLTFVAVPEATTMIAGALLLIPFGLQAIQFLRSRKQPA